MTAKRFSVNMENYVLDNVTGKGYVADNNIDANLIRDLLNEFHEENQQLKKDIKQIHTYIDNAILTERTRMGKNCLKQLKEGLQ